MNFEKIDAETGQITDVKRISKEELLAQIDGYQASIDANQREIDFYKAKQKDVEEMLNILK